MNILLSFQTLHDSKVFDEIINLSLDKNIDTIYIVSSLMNDVDINTITKYNNINKLTYINSNTLFDNKCFSQNIFNLKKQDISNNNDLYINYISSFRWVPISIKKEIDTWTFSISMHYDILNFWNNFFSMNQIDSVILLNDEHSSLDKILIDTAKKYSINNIVTASIIGANASEGEEYFAFYNSNENDYTNLSKLKNNLQMKRNTLKDNDFKTFSDEYNNNASKFKFYITKLYELLNDNISIVSKLKILINKLYNKIYTSFYLQKQLKYIESLKVHYKNISQDPKDGKTYVYYCLHFDPEATTLPKDNDYSNQLLNIRIIASSLPKDWILYVKEHPHQLDCNLYKNIFLNQLHNIELFRSKSFYNYINNLNNVMLLSLSSNHKELIQNAQYIVSNTGTVFREATYMNKECMTFSEKSIYEKLNNIHKVNDLDSCKQVFSNQSVSKVSDIDEIFDKYSITITDINKRDVDILRFIIKKILFKDNYND